MNDVYPAIYERLGITKYKGCQHMLTFKECIGGITYNYEGVFYLNRFLNEWMEKHKNCSGMNTQLCKCNKKLIGNNPEVCVDCGMIPVDCECVHAIL